MCIAATSMCVNSSDFTRQSASSYPMSHVCLQ